MLVIRLEQVLLYQLKRYHCLSRYRLQLNYYFPLQEFRPHLYLYTKWLLLLWWLYLLLGGATIVCTRQSRRTRKDLRSMAKGGDGGEGLAGGREIRHGVKPAAAPRVTAAEAADGQAAAAPGTVPLHGLDGELGAGGVKAAAAAQGPAHGGQDGGDHLLVGPAEADEQVLGRVHVAGRGRSSPERRRAAAKS